MISFIVQFFIHIYKLMRTLTKFALKPRNVLEDLNTFKTKVRERMLRVHMLWQNINQMFKLVFKSF
jgi:hypothetical protein